MEHGTSHLTWPRTARREFPANLTPLSDAANITTTCSSSTVRLDIMCANINCYLQSTRK